MEVVEVVEGGIKAPVSSLALWNLSITEGERVSFCLQDGRQVGEVVLQWQREVRAVVGCFCTSWLGVVCRRG